MRVLVIGSGGREHALCWALARSTSVRQVLCAPGNAGTAAVAQSVELDPGDHAAVVAFARAAADLVVIGPEKPLADGLADALRAAGVRVVGPGAGAARLEASKAFTKQLCAANNIPTAAFARFDDVAAALVHVRAAPLPIVVKADGLASGKGVVVAATRVEAEAAVVRLGALGPLVIEEFLAGTEASLFALVDGETVVPFGTARDHKRVGEGDTGPNTGGMGAVSPAPGLSDAAIADTLERIVRPTARALVAAGTPFQGWLYAGLMLTADGPKLIEYNVRLGDPEAQALLPRLRSDLGMVLMAVAEGRLGEVGLEWDARIAVSVVVAARGYPDAARAGGIVAGLDAVAAAGSLVFHAGTARDADGCVVATGGRVLAATALGATVEAARHLVYGALGRLDYADGFWRGDIGLSERSVLFVCLGNICRSPLADGIFRRVAAEEGLAVRVDSAGTGDWHLGHAPDPRAQAVARANGDDIADLRARLVTPDDFMAFDEIVAMDASNLADLRAMRPAGSRARLSRLMDHAPGEGVADVPDPYAGDAAGFDETYRLVTAGARGLAASMKAPPASKGS